MIAIDIALLPPQEIMQKAIDVNRVLNKQHQTNIKLSIERCLPHITLLMGVLPVAEIKTIAPLIEETAKPYLPLTLESTQTTQSRCWIELKKSPAVEKLHTALADKLLSRLAGPATEEAIFYDEGEVPGAMTVPYVRNFRQNSAYEKYIPHITIDSGPEHISYEPFSFTCRRIAVCHIGNYCTCRKILSEFSI